MVEVEVAEVDIGPSVGDVVRKAWLKQQNRLADVQVMMTRILIFPSYWFHFFRTRYALHPIRQNI